VEKRFVLFIAIAVVVMIGWGWIQEKIWPTPKAKPTAQAPAVAGTKAPETENIKAQTLKPMNAIAKTPKLAAVLEQKASLKNEKVEATFSNVGARATSWKLLSFKEFQKRPEPVELVVMSPTAQAENASLGMLEMEGAGLESRTWTLEGGKAQALPDGSSQVRFVVLVPELKLRVMKTFLLQPNRYDIKVSISVEDLSGQARKISSVALRVGPGLGQPHPEDSTNMLVATLMTDKTIVRETAESGTSDIKEQADRALWVGLKNHYFSAVLLPASANISLGQIRRHADGTASAALVAKDLPIPAKGVLQMDAVLYGGPQEYETLASYGSKLHKLIDFGWFSFFADPMLQLLKMLYKVTRNYGWAIILLTALVKAALWYPSTKGMTSMRHFQKAQAQLQPRLESLKKTYKDDAKRLNEETMKLYKEMGVNPVAGCLPMLVQIPIFIALYSSLNNAFELRGAPFMAHWTDLSAPDTLWILPVAMGVTMWIQQKITPTMSSTPEAAQQQKIMLWMMPIMLTGMSVWFAWPVGLLLYMTVQNVLGIAQQVYINKTVV
jgi:YidC/Oxa1 family membrane protein insertase